MAHPSLNGLAGQDHSHDGSSDHVTDPVCGMTVDPDKTGHHARHDARDYHFCSGGCKTKFVADPEYYISGKHREAQDNT
ncbi:MAG: YHS domain-containing protein, partial [Parasphingorhabdus sp.]|uniref:YHS domain-containing protein n=1 Tax=Parasphingorhabdus sp. TaxID=2709688 RepID=UPI003002B5AA